MLNPKTNQRELAYIVKIDNISGMDADKLECAHVRGWNIVVGKGEFDVGDLAVYFEIDSKLPEMYPFTEMEFLKSKHYKIKSQKIRGVVSQGLLVPVYAFGWVFDKRENCVVVNSNPPKDKTKTSNYEFVYHEGDFLTETLGVTYAVVEDNKRKSSVDRYKAMSQRNPNLAKTTWWRWLYRRPWGKKLLFVFFGKKKDVKKDWPAWVVKTDEERCQNLIWDNYKGTTKWFVTEKIDGTSTTFTMKRGEKTLFGRNPNQYFVCSRNVVFDKPDKQCFYDTNYYLQMSEKYNVEKALSDYLMLHEDIDWVTLQGETYGKGVQKRDYSIDGVDFMGFNFIDSKNGRWNSVNASMYVTRTFGIPWVPILDVDMQLPETVEEMVKYADGNSVLDGKMREGVVIRSIDGIQSFKAVSNDYLIRKGE